MYVLYWNFLLICGIEIKINRRKSQSQFGFLKYLNHCVSNMHGNTHGLRTPNEGINQRYLKNWAVPKNLGLGLNFRPYSEGCFLSGRP